MAEHKINKRYKDRVFRIIFHEKKDLLELYNAINDSDYTNPDDLTITTIEDVVYMGVKNDLSFIIGDVMNLYEHQSSFSPNLPLRGLFYFSSLYREYIEPIKHRLYSTSPLYIPFPQYIVFYNGTKNEPAVDDCVRNGILADILRKNRSEVVNMILTEYDEEEFRKAWREDLINEGLVEGIKATIRICMKCNIPKEQARENLMEEFSLSEREAENYLEKYWK